MDTTTFVSMTQRVKDSVYKVPEKLGVMLPSELKPSSSILSMQLVMSQGKVHTKSSYYKKISRSYYEKPLQKAMTFAKFQNILSPYHQTLHTQVTLLAVLEDMHKESTPFFPTKSLNWLLPE